MNRFFILLLLLSASLAHANETTTFHAETESRFTTTIDVEQGGQHQIWLTYRSDQAESFPLRLRGGSLTIPGQGQPTPAPGQYFRHYLGDLLFKAGDEVSLTIETDARGFAAKRLELIPVPSFSPELEPLLHTSLAYYDQLVRTPEGLYRDGWIIGSPARDQLDQPSPGSPRPLGYASSAAAGVGLMALCIAHELKLDPEAEAKALQTLDLFNGKNPDIHLDRDGTGFFQHFQSVRDGSSRSEFSTIDTAILIVGALYCRNTFDSPEIHEAADSLWQSIDWSSALAQPDGERLHMVMADGAPAPRTLTRLFSEYHLLAWLIREYELQTRGTSKVNLALKNRWPYRKMTLLTDGRPRAHSSFQVQFPFYMCHPATTDPLYFSFVGNQARADHFTSAEKNGNDAYWGSGAGGTPDDGYLASDFLNNPGRVVSPRIISGFMPAYPVAQQQLLRLYRDPARRLSTPIGDLLPRFSIDQPDWQHHRIEAIDFSSMMFGLAAMHPDLGMAFFEEKTRFTFESDQSED